MRFQFPHRVLSSTTLLAALLLCPTQGTAEVINRIIATVDGEPITMYALKQFEVRATRMQQAPPGTDAKGMLDLLVTDKIIDKEISAQGIVVRDEDVDHYITNIKQRNNLSDVQLQQALVQQGLTMEGYRIQVRQDLQKVQLINKEIRGKVNITPEEVERYYKEHREDYPTEGEGVTVSHILLRLPENPSQEQVAEAFERANQLWMKLNDGADFAALASENSEDSVAQRGGKLGTFGKGEMLEEMEKSTTGLKSGEYTKPFRSKLGIHIAKVDSRTSEPGADGVVEGLAAEIKEKLYNAALEERYNRWLREDLRQKHHVEILN